MTKNDTKLVEITKVEAESFLGKVFNNIGAADNKVSIGLTVFPIIDLILTFLFVYNINPIVKLWGSFSSNKWYFVIVFGSFILFIFSFIASLLLYFLAISPRFSGSVKKDIKTSFSLNKELSVPNDQKFSNMCINLNFYEDICKFKKLEYFIYYVCSFYTLRECEDIMKELYFNSKICHRKMHLFKTGLWMAFVSIILGLISIITLMIFAGNNPSTLLNN